MQKVDKNARFRKTHQLEKEYCKHILNSTSLRWNTHLAWLVGIEHVNASSDS